MIRVTKTTQNLAAFATETGTVFLESESHLVLEPITALVAIVDYLSPDVGRFMEATIEIDGDTGGMKHTLWLRNNVGQVLVFSFTVPAELDPYDMVADKLVRRTTYHTAERGYFETISAVEALENLVSDLCHPQRKVLTAEAGAEDYLLSLRTGQAHQHVSYTFRGIEIAA